MSKIDPEKDRQPQDSQSQNQPEHVANLAGRLAFGAVKNVAVGGYFVRGLIQERVDKKFKLRVEQKEDEERKIQETAQANLAYDEQSRKDGERRKKDKVEYFLNKAQEVNEKPGFSITEFIEHRKAAKEWTTVEIGPGRRPSGLNRDFSGQSKYIGIEAALSPTWATSPQIYDVFDSLKEDRPNENISVMLDYSVFEAHEMERSSIGRARMESFYEGVDPEIADEVFCVNVFDDLRTQSEMVRDEAFRLLKPGGYFIIADEFENFPELLPWLERKGFELKQAAGDFDNPFAQRSIFTIFREPHTEGHLALMEGLLGRYESSDLLIFQKPLETT